MTPDPNPATPSPAIKPPVLVVDDEYGPREAISFTLASDFEVETASRAPEALQKLQAKAYAAVVMDIRMPGMNGIQALEELRKIDAEVSVIMLTGYGTLLTAQQAMLAGANQYLRKPPDVNELLDAVRKQAAATKQRRHEARMNREALALNEALKREIERAEPEVWQGRASVELVHDLNNPLTVVIGYAGMLVDEAEALAATDAERTGKLAAHARLVAQAAEYCRHLADNWRQAARAHHESTVVDLVAVAREVRQVIFFGTEKIQIEGLEAAMVRGSKFELMRILQNLFKNALEAGASRLIWRAARAGSSFEVTIRDNGAGMPPEVLRKALHGGFSSKASGLGLGLSICRHLLGTHGATVNIESETGKGTLITLNFPVAQA